MRAESEDALGSRLWKDIIIEPLVKMRSQVYPRPPKVKAGLTALDGYKEQLDYFEYSLRNRHDREFYRKDLRSRAKFYATLAKKRPEASEERAFYEALSDLLAHQLDAYGPEASPKRRKKPNACTNPLAYPDFSADLTNRVHFLASGSLKRERSSALAEYADAVHRQTAPNGDVLLSVGVSSSRVQFFERLIESTGSDGLGVPLKSGSFAGWIRPDGSLEKSRDFEDVASPWRRIADDNFRARLYHWSLRRGQLSPSIKLPQDGPPIPESLPWDPDPRFQAILQSTQEDRLLDAVELLEAIPGAEREVLFDEVIYLRYLTRATLRGEDIRYLARQYVVSSPIRPQLEEGFEDFIFNLDRELVEVGPLTNDFPGFEDHSWVYESDPSEFVRNTPPRSDWPATRRHYYRAFELYGHPIAPRGRIFVWHPNLAGHSLSMLQNALAPQMVAAENVFRRARGIPEIGRGWVSEVALYDLVRSRYPDAVHQWRPSFLGLQSVDIFLPSEKIAIEYQGQQHFEAVELFGGQDGLRATRVRDARKKAILEANGIRLIEWRYDLPVTAENVDKKLITHRDGDHSPQ